MLSRITKCVLVLTFGAGIACSAAPGDDLSGPAWTAGAAHDDAGAEAGIHPDLIVKGPLCNASVCNAACTEQPGVSGGHCVGSDCLCNAPTCGQFGQAPCAGNYCSQGHYDAWLNACDDCGTTGATCCDLDHPGATTSCYGGLFCQGGTVCRTCGGKGENPCEPASGSSFCNSGLVVAVSAGETVCATACGLVNQLPCAVGGCTQQDAEVIAGSPNCQWNPSCGHLGQGCCDAGNFFQGPNSTEDLCHDGSTCCYSGFEGLGSWQCSSDPTCGGGGGEGDCDPDTEDCPDVVRRSAHSAAH